MNSCCSGCSGVKFESVSSRQWGKEGKQQLRGRTSTWLAVDGFVGGGAHVKVVVVSLSPRILSLRSRQDRSDKRYCSRFF